MDTLDALNNVPDAHLRAMADLFRAKNDDYGAAYGEIGDVLCALFRNEPVTLATPSEFARFACFARMADKMLRYAHHFTTPGGHEDSLRDLGTQAAMLLTLDLDR